MFGALLLLPLYCSTGNCEKQNILNLVGAVLSEVQGFNWTVVSYRFIWGKKERKKERKKNKSDFDKGNFMFITFVDLSGKQIIFIFFVIFLCFVHI